MSEDQSREAVEREHAQRAEHAESAGASGPGMIGELAPSATPALPMGLLGNPRLDGRGNAPVRVALLQRMQHTYGNRAVQRFLQRRATIHTVHAAHSDEDISAQIQSRAGHGSSLDAGVQRTLEQGLGANLSGVRIHADGEADHLARSVDAVAFTTGSDIFFREGAYDPSTSQGMHLLAHETAHTIQQSQGPVPGTATAGGVSISDPSDPFEQAAERTADRLVARRQASVQATPGSANGAPAASVQRENKPDDEEEQVLQTKRYPSHLAPVQRQLPAGRGQTDSVRRGTSRPMAIQRAYEEKKAPNWGKGSNSHMGFNPHADLTLDGAKGGGGAWFNSGHTDSITIPRDSSGVVKLNVDVFWLYDNGRDGWKGGTIKTGAEVRFKVSPEGKLEFTAGPALSADGGDPQVLTHKETPSKELSSDENGQLGLNVHVESVSSTTTTKSDSKTDTESQEQSGEVSAEPEGVGVKIGGKSGTSTSKTQGTSTGTTTSGGLFWDSGYNLNLVVAPAGPTTIPEVTIHGAATKIKFGIDKWQLMHTKPPMHPPDQKADNAVGEIVRWFASIDDEGKDLLKSGQNKVSLTGHASTTASHEYNLELSAKRTDAVKNVLLKAVPGLKPDSFDIENLGKELAGTADNVEAEEERRVDVVYSWASGQSSTPPPSGAPK
jgi:hypothetical protein